MTTIVELNGGLGNQLFQLGVALELRVRGHAVKLDAAMLVGARRLEIVGLCDGIPLVDQRSRAERIGSRFVLRERLIVEPSLRFDRHILEIEAKRRWRLRGYWQSEFYFPTVARAFRAAIYTHCTAFLTTAGMDLREEMLRKSAIALHVRRGDYVVNPRAAATHGVLPMSYYEGALARLDPEAPVYVFSDDLEWVRSAFLGPRFHVVDRSFCSAAAGELALMAACSQRVIANSSFSWWGAWIGGGGEVVAPANWFVDPQFESSDLIPKRWVRV